MVSSRRVLITLNGGAPWGFRLTGGGALPLTINKIRKKSRAHVQGLREGDAVISINGVHVHDKTQDEALELVEAAGDSLTLEIFRGESDEQSRDKPKKPVQVPVTGNATGSQLRLLTTADDGVSPGEVILIPSMHSVASKSLDTAESDVNRGGSTPRVRVNVKSTSTVRVVSVGSSSGQPGSAFANTAVLDRSPVISADARAPDVHYASTAPTLAAKPFLVTQSGSPEPSPPHFSQQPPHVSPKPQKTASSQVPQPPPQPPHGPQTLSASVAPQTFASPQLPPVCPKPPGVTSSTSSSVFDDGQIRQEVTREQRVQRSDDGSSTTVVLREATTTTTGRPSFVKSQASAFNAVQPSDAGLKPQSVHKTTTKTTSLKTTTSVINQKGPTPFSSSASPNILQFQTSALTPSRSLAVSAEPLLFKPTRFVPNSGKKEIPGLYTPTSPLADVGPYTGFKDGKENMAPQPMFQVKNIVSDKAKNSARDVWRPNMWLPGQQPPGTQEELQVATPREDVPPHVPKPKPGRSLVEEQKRKLLASQTSRNEYDDSYSQEKQEQFSNQGHHKHERLHVFAPPVEIHADDDDEPSSPDSFGQKKKRNLYSDSAFYDTPGKNYPTITEQMKLCKIIAQSLTSAANRRARGAKMFMKRKRKSSKWVHEGQSELSSSTGDVANLHELDSELSPEDGGNKPLLYFKIPNLKNRVGNEGKQTKMALTQEEFEKLRLSAKKCDHSALPPDTCFDIVADLKAHKGRGGRLFERRKQRSDKFVFDETNAKFPLPVGKRENDQAGSSHPTPWEVALKHGAKVEQPPAASLPAVRTSLKSDESPFMLKGKNFNRTARGWSGGGEYPVAENLYHISPIRDLGATHPAHLQEQQDYRDKVKIWQATGEPVSSPAQDWPPDLQSAREQGYPKPSRQDLKGGGRAGQRQNNYQTPRPKSWHPQNYDNQAYRDGQNLMFSPVDYSPASAGYPSVAYKQPIIPGTDL